jgi:NAD-dependent deacetylase
MLPQEVWLAAAQATGACDCFLVVGTSAVVYPAAGLVEMAQAAGAGVIEVNLEATQASARADVCLHGPSGVLLPQLVRRLESD